MLKLTSFNEIKLQSEARLRKGDYKPLNYCSSIKNNGCCISKDDVKTVMRTQNRINYDKTEPFHRNEAIK